MLLEAGMVVNLRTKFEEFRYRTSLMYCTGKHIHKDGLYGSAAQGKLCIFRKYVAFIFYEVFLAAKLLQVSSLRSSDAH